MLLICMKKQTSEWSNADFHFNFLFCAEFAVDKEASVSVYIYIYYLTETVLSKTIGMAPRARSLCDSGI